MAKSRKGLRPHLWMYQGEIPHQQHIAWMRMKAQCKFREEQFDLTMQQFQAMWEGRWHLRGRANSALCLSRKDPLKPWDVDNCQITERILHLQRQSLFKQCKRTRLKL